MEDSKDKLKKKIQEAEETLEAIKSNKVDALVVNTEAGQKIFTLQDSESFNENNLSKTIMDMTSEAIIVCDNNGKILRFNRGAAILSDLPVLENEIDSVFNLFTDKGERIFINKLPESSTQSFSEFIFNRKDKKSFALDISKELLKDVNGTVQGFVITMFDITRHRLAESKAMASLHEKNVLIKEINHRVKNSLQLIISLINLQSMNIKDPETEAMFTDLKTRLKSISLIHEKLYNSESISEIKMDKYIIDLINYLKESYKFKDKQIEFIFDIDPIFIEPERVVTIGLILNELITNSIKYAFPKQGGNIWITMKQQGEETILIIKDDGVGMNESFKIEESNTLGLQLVMSLTEQLGGVIKFSGKKGSEVIITFKIIYDKK